jgi:hypothetical protein
MTDTASILVEIEHFIIEYRADPCPLYAYHIRELASSLLYIEQSKRLDELASLSQELGMGYGKE